MNKPLILFVEDSVPIVENLQEFFGEKNYQLDYATDGLTALNLLANNSYDAVVLDIMLPGVNGVKICQQIRAHISQTLPILLLTALESIEDKEKGYIAGADDYLCKPFELRELELRINALLRRKTTDSGLIIAGDISYNPGSLTVAIGSEKKACLSGLSATLFEILMRSYPKYLTYESLGDEVWGSEEINDNTIRTHIYSLRKHLKSSLGRSLIKGIYGKGYQLDPEHI